MFIKTNEFTSKHKCDFTVEVNAKKYYNEQKAEGKSYHTRNRALVWATGGLVVNKMEKSLPAQNL